MTTRAKSLAVTSWKRWMEKVIAIHLLVLSCVAGRQRRPWITEVCRCRKAVPAEKSPPGRVDSCTDAEEKDLPFTLPRMGRIPTVPPV